MRTIYYKEAPENPESLKVLLKDYFDKGSPATYWADSNEFQCGEYRNRSIDDLILLANHYFSGSTCKDVLNAYVELTEDIKLIYEEKRYVFFVCGTINKPVLSKGIYREVDKRYPIDNLILYSNHMDAQCKNSDYTIKSMKELLDND